MIAAFPAEGQPCLLRTGGVRVCFTAHSLTHLERNIPGSLKVTTYKKAVAFQQQKAYQQYQHLLIF